ncbi:hypothetical protein C2E23DRAFT_49285 [Lenzites betulinus]|nr:hypothetical protein C2E23DRAFT_49285 [Lenzites betulinus]
MRFVDLTEGIWGGAAASSKSPCLSLSFSIGESKQPRNATASMDQHIFEDDSEQSDYEPSSAGSSAVNDERETSGLPPPSTTIQSLLARALGGAKELERENEYLRKRVEALQSRLDRVVEADDALLQSRIHRRMSRMSKSEMTDEMWRLEKQVERLEKSNEKCRKRIHQLSMDLELNNDAKGLAAQDVESADSEDSDDADKMRELLRRFRDIMCEKSLGRQEEDCGICMETLRLHDARSFPCQHAFCSECVAQLESDPHIVDDYITRCPICRQGCKRWDIELIRYTASEQWDDLREVAKLWAAMDVRRAKQLSEEEEENAVAWIYDSDAETQSSDSSTDAESEPVHADSPASTPEPQGDGQRQHSETPIHAPGRVRRRQAIMGSPSSDDEPAVADVVSTASQPVAGSSTAVVAEPPSEEQAGSLPYRAHTPVTDEEAGPSYSQSPVRDKRKRLQELAEARSKKRRI